MPSRRGGGVLAAAARRRIAMIAAVSAASSAAGVLASGTSASWTCPAPSGLVAGNLLLAFQYVASSNTPSLAGPSGWAQAGNLFGAGSSVGYMAVWWKVVTSAEQTTPPATYTFTGSSPTAISWYPAAAITQYANAKGVNLTTATLDGASTTSHAAPSITTTETNDFLVCAYGLFTPVAITAGPTGMTARTNAISAGNEGINVYDQLAAAAGATGARTATTGSGEVTCAVSVAVTRTAPVTITNLPPQPGAVAYGPAGTALSLLGQYAHPGGMVISSRGNYNQQVYHNISAAGGHHLLYFDPIVRPTFSDYYHDLLFYSSVYGSAVPLWPGSPSANGTGYLADFRVGGVLQGKVEAVMEKMVSDNNHIAGFFLDDVGARSWFPNFDWSTWSATDQQAYRNGAIAICQTARTVANRHGLIFLVNGVWTAGTLASNGGGYPTMTTHGCSLADGGVVEHHDTEVSYFGPYMGQSTSQWGTAPGCVSAAKPFCLSINDTAAGVTAYVNDGRAAWVSQQTTDQYDGVVPYSGGTFHATGLPSVAS